MMAGKLSIDGKCFRDSVGRHVILRGVNFGGDCKVPVTPDGHTYRRTSFSDHRDVSFVGRPAPLAEIDAHLARIRQWGFNCLRLLTTWEAVEHAGPGIYDEAYLDYFAEVCRRAGEHGLHVFVDFHQDVWSRMSGGDGAPGWTFEAVGLDFTKFDAADAAHVMQYRYDEGLGGRQAGYPTMSWGANYRMPANGIMWTLFFAGGDFAPMLRIDGTDAQSYLQDHYLGAMAAIAARVADLDHVIGFDTLNEPGSGWIGKSLSHRSGLLKGAAWSPLDGFAVASGHSRTLPLIEGGDYLANAARTPIWLSGHDDPFRAAGAWDVDDDGTPVALREDFFMTVAGQPVDIERDYRLPFYHRVAATIRSIRSDWLVFAEADPFGGRPFPEGMPERTVNASHWYDLAALVTKRFDPHKHQDLITGEPLMSQDAIRQSYIAGLGKVAHLGDTLGTTGAPSLIGEFGIPYDLNDAEAYHRWATGERDQIIWDKHTTALSLMYDALDVHLLSSTQWNYTVSNANDAKIGDGWNQEDLSIWSRDQIDDGTNDGGRAVAGFCRPYVCAAAGTIAAQSYDANKRQFVCTILPTAVERAGTEIFLPHFSDKGRWSVMVDGVMLDHASGGLLEVAASLQPIRIGCHFDADA